MATKSVTLKDSNGDTLYPVTDSNVVNINQQKTLAQALDGVVYAEDPTQNATPTAWVTGSDIDWTTTAQSYSTTEVDTGATWIDGKPIYKKTVYKSSISSGDIDTAHGISNISKIIKHEAFYVTSGSYKQLPIVANTSGGNYSVVWAVNSTYINTVSTATLSDFYITLWYTKTTD